MSSASLWLSHLEGTFPEHLSIDDFHFVEEYEHHLAEVATRKVEPRPKLAEIKAKLASLGYGGIDVALAVGGLGKSPLVQMLIQFASGYHDVDFRDVAHIAHGRMILRHASDGQRNRWLHRILSGELVGIAATEKHGGSNLYAIKTTAVRGGDGKWSLSGEKCWISRIYEASVFVVFFKVESATELSAALVDAKSAGIRREGLNPDGLRGWSWGKLVFDEVTLSDDDFLGGVNCGLQIFRDHFLYYRPMVAATALGGAAAAFDNVVWQIRQRLGSHTIDNCRDSALDILARSYVSIHSCLLSALMAQVLVERGSSFASLWSRGAKANSVETAVGIVSNLALLSGAMAYEENSAVGKILNDLRGLLYADGIQDALYRAVGRSIIREY